MIDAAGYDHGLGEARAALAAGTGLDDVLVVLRRQGFSQVDSIRAVRALTGASLAEAKETVDASPAWADLRKSHEDLQRAFVLELTDGPVAERLRGRKLAGARYLGGANPATGPVREVAHGVALDFAGGGGLLARWERAGERESLVLGDPEPAGDQVDVSATPEWQPLLGRTIEHVGVAWHEAGEHADRCAVRLEFDDGSSVVLALGEIRDGVATYAPTSVVVFFDADLARAYDPAGDGTSAWGDDIL
ncbi:hypothetical protein VA596_03700 [Amycolatopsis sp., V23-08]|uniref:Large ribosomal subunit protein bL12 C-terminal domain-containing protein n=1 Tax=Amycolatopsis heterodermiae TaxID=3110235 RepID=A0ABU5QXG8_9PSEU|nr:hypothetical protein [Amycolatopsis sp., V23-08]MEA5358628.1 hypothetical protein [Amycolatopsis sp., V23-08]